MKQVDSVDCGERERGEGKESARERGTVLQLWRRRSADCRLSLALLTGVCVQCVCVQCVCVCSLYVSSLCAVCHEVIKNNNK